VADRRRRDHHRSQRRRVRLARADLRNAGGRAVCLSERGPLPQLESGGRAGGRRAHVLREHGLTAPLGRVRRSMDQRPVLVAGGGIGGLSRRTHAAPDRRAVRRAGVGCASEPLGVGINCSRTPCASCTSSGSGRNALDAIGVQTKEWALVGLNGNDVYTEPRGLLAGYKWPQYSVHRGGLQMLLHRTAVDRLGADAIRTGVKVTGYRNHDDGCGVSVLVRADGEQKEIEGALLIGVRTACIRPCARRCIPTSRRSSGAARSCGAGPRRACRSAPARRSSASVLIATASSSTRSPDPTAHGPRHDQLDRGDHRR
jgi:hypothetical protein